MSEQLTQGIVRVLDGNGDIAGTGFVISESGLIATCSHVIQHEELQKRGEPRPEKVAIVFHATGDKQDALVEPDWWLPWNAGDMAIIRVEGVLPPGVQPLPLGPAEGTSGHEISSFGFPDVDTIEGLGGNGRVVRVLPGAGGPMVQLQSSEITVGFSGAPIWDKLGRRVIGMVSAITEPDRHHRLEETAFAIATETLRAVCPVLQLSEVCPYRGLAAFTEADTEFFFGRQQIVDGLQNRLRRDSRFLMVLGPSGSGKSSVVQAGLIPQVRNGKVPGSECWGIIVTRPAAQPFDELTKQGVVDGSHDLTENVQAWLNQHVEQERLMLVIDQFEELLSICPEAVRQDFITQLVNLLHSPLSITVVLVMRDDFYSRLSQQEALMEWLERSGGPTQVPRFLKQDELIAIVQKPIEAVGLRFEEGLVETIVKDTMETAGESEDGGQAGRSAVLPLLEFSLTELWKRRQEGMLTHEAYRSIGGVAGALTQWADRTFYTLKPDERRLAQRILTDLIYIGDKSQGIFNSRRRRTLISLNRNKSEQESVQRVVQHLVENRLLATDRDLQSNEETVEIIHDALLREWGQLHEWLEKDRSFLTWHLELERLVHVWVVQLDKNKLLRGRDLTEAEEWLKKREADLSQDEVAFIRASARQRLRSVASIMVIVLLLLSTTGITGWLLSRPSPPDPTQVTTLNDNGTGSLRWAIDTAKARSTIRFRAGLHGTILLTSADLTFDKNLTIRGPDAETIAISGGSSGFEVHVPKGISVSISRLGFENNNVDCSASTAPVNSCASSILNEGTLTLTDSVISHNVVSSGGDTGIIDNEGGTLSLIRSIVSDNMVDGVDGAGLSSFSGTVNIINSTISHNTCTCRNGGGFGDVGSTIFLTNSTVSDNTIDGGDGGGLAFTLSNVILSNSTISNNTATGNGGGIYDEGSTILLTNSTISDNTATGGGGLFITPQSSPEFTPAQADLTFCTIDANMASTGSDMMIQGQSKVTIRNSIVVANIAHYRPDITGTLTSDGYNVFQNNVGAIFHPRTQQHLFDQMASMKNLANLFAPPAELRMNGGSTQTYALDPGSPAIDQIPLASCQLKGITTDQRGSIRPDGNELFCDIGAYESTA